MHKLRYAEYVWILCKIGNRFGDLITFLIDIYVFDVFCIDFDEIDFQV